MRIATRAGRPAYYTISQTASMLGVGEPRIHRAIRLGTLRAERRNGRLVIPAPALIKLLGRPTVGGADD